MLPKKLPRWAGFLLLFALIFTLTACDGLDIGILATDTPMATLEPAPTPTTPPVTEPAPTPTTAEGEEQSQGQAFIESLDVAVLESFPVQVQATVSGNLSDGCTSLEATTVERQGTTFNIILTTSYDTSIVCTQALVPFQETVSLDVQGLPAGTYTVTTGELSETFTLQVDNAPPATPDLGAASLSVSPGSAQIGDAVTLTGNGFPPGVLVEIGFGRVNSEYGIIANTQTGEDGSFMMDVIIPDFAEPQDQWVFVADVNNAKVVTDPIAIMAGNGTGGTPEAGVNEPVNGLFVKTYMYLIATGDAGQSGPMIGCDDSVVPVVIDIEPTIAPMTAIINRLLRLDEQFYGQSGLYNVFYQSDLTLQGIDIENREAIISLTGDLQLGGVCDEPRILAQLEYTATQYSTVDSATILLNGQPLESQLGGQ